MNFLTRPIQFVKRKLNVNDAQKGGKITAARKKQKTKLVELEIIKGQQESRGRVGQNDCKLLMKKT